ncbi:hypothetical protein [Amycolatopsis aidingensis]|uniref:hypothetical protein n=1 Tax=Amycolatopsis aidingensis TaxID=2842453 RepID=UPI001C0D942A|nr:hypothetical protein [Amycolatopsis aidingensis]
MATTNKRGVLTTLGLGAVLVLCCAAPALIAAGALGALGAWLGNPWVIGAALAAAVVIWRIHRRHRRGHTSTRDPSDRSHPDGNDRPSGP